MVTLLLNKDIELKNIKVNIPESLTMATNFLGGEEISLKANLLLKMLGTLAKFCKSAFFVD